MAKPQFMKEQKGNKVEALTSIPASVRSLNDQLRIHGKGGRILMTAGVQALSDQRRRRVFEAVKAYTAFTADNDPYGEHDFGEVEIDTISVMFKIDYYDVAGRFHSPDPANPAMTMRVMTLMLSDEY